MKRILLVTIVTVVLLLANKSSIAQMYGYGSPYGFGSFWNMDPYKSRFYEIGIVSGMNSPTFEIEYVSVDSKGRQSEKKTYGKAKVKYNIGLSSGGSFQLAKLSDRSALALNITGQVTLADLTLTDKDLNVKNTVPFTFQRNVVNVSLPLSLDVKVGAEGASDRTLKSMYTFGAGAALRVCTFDMGNEEGSGYIQVSPFLKAEAGYFAGVAFKLRAQYFLGTQMWSDGYFNFHVTENTAPYSDTYYKASTGGELVLSLIVMPFSRAWDN